MLLDELQQTWKAQPAARISVDPEVLLQTLRRNQRDFRLTIFWRDFREVIVAAALAVYFFVIGLRDEGWTWMLLAASCVWVAGYFVVDRYRRRTQAANVGDSLSDCIEASLSDVEHQIWLLKNIFWWYLLPPSIALAVHFAKNWQPRVAFLVAAAVCAAAYVFVYWLNQYAIKHELEPRRQELLAVRDDLMWNEE